MEYHVLASGSKGNATFIYEDGTGILIDCGITRKQLLYKLSNLGFKQQDITYVLLTHDHYDHKKNIHIFPLDIVYSGEGNIDDLDENNILYPYEPINLLNFTITPLPLSHDATNTMGFIIEGKQEKILYMTDTGYVTQKNMNYIKDLDYYIIEANHDVEMLMATRRPLYLKERIYGDTGHLNNEYSANLMSKVITERTKEIVLAHLSQEANTPEIALNTYYKVFEEKGVDFDLDNIKAASQINVVSGGNHED